MLRDALLALGLATGFVLAAHSSATEIPGVGVKDGARDAVGHMQTGSNRTSRDLIWLPRLCSLGSVIVVELGLEVDSGLIIGCSPTIEHVHLPDVFVDDTRRWNFYGAG